MASKKIGIAFPPELEQQARSRAAKEGTTFSALVVRALASALNVPAPVRARGGDLARFKAPETHAMVCAKMRATKARKRSLANAGSIR